MLQLIKKPESGVNGTAVYEVPDEKANSLTWQPWQIGRNVHYFLIEKALAVMQEVAQGNKWSQQNKFRRNYDENVGAATFARNERKARSDKICCRYNGKAYDNLI
jgi:hypothetical protein